MSKLIYYAITVITLGLVSVFSPAKSGDHINLNIPIQGMRGRVGKCTIELLDTEDNIIGKAYRYTYINNDYFSLPVKVKLDADIEDFDLIRVKVQFKDDIRVYSFHQLQDRMIVKILGQDQFIKGTPVTYRIIVQNQRSNEPLQNARIRVTLEADDVEKTVYEGRTDRSGTCRAEFILAEDIEHADLKFAVSSDIGEDEYATSIKVVTGNITYLVTDKPIYQPGQVIHIRTLSLKKPDLAAVSGDVTFEVEDSKGNKVFKKIITTDEFGTAYIPFRLADEVNFGDYTVRAILTGEKTEKTVKVEKYVLPKFKITMTTDREFYLPGERIEGDIDVQYFFGKPVIDGKVKITVYRFDIGFQKEAVLDGKTSSDGLYHFSYDLPDYFVGEPLEKGDAFVRLDVEVIDKANHSEKISAKKKVVQDVIGLSIVPEGGSLRLGLDNRIYVLATYPDGSPCTAQVEMQIDKKKLTAKTDDFGIAEFSYKPADAKTTILVTAQDDKGETARLEKSFSLDVDRDQIIMRIPRGIYKVGEKIELDVLSTKRTGRAYLDVIKDNQTILTKSVDIHNGRGTYTLNLTPDISGSIWLHAYIVTPGSDIVRDTRFCFVHPATDLNIAVSGDKPEYLPGEDGQIRFTVTDTDGAPVVAALCVAIVDEAVFAVSELHPGLEKVYFLLEKEILTPRYEIHGFQPEEIVRKPGIEPRAENVMFSTLEPKEPFPVHYTTPQDIDTKVQQAFYNRLVAAREIIYAAINKYLAKHNEYPKSETALEEFIDEGFLREEDLFDPWLRHYQVTTSDAEFTWFNIASAGADGVFGNQDDISDAMWWGWEGDGKMFLEAEQMMMPRAAAAVPMPDARIAKGAVPIASKTNGDRGPREPRVREYFPETFVFEPALITDPDGIATLSLTMPDAITTWRVTSFASSATGDLGSVLSEIKVFQEFFVDIDLPVALTQGDEISIPVAMYNYLPREQEIRVQLQEEEWFDVQGKLEIKKKLQKDEVSVVYFPIKVNEIGYHSMLVRAYGEVKSDAIKRTIAVLPDGRKFEDIISDRLEGTVAKAISFPANAIPDANSAMLKIFPGIYSQIVEGLDGLFRMPFGCFEQTSSVTYPNILLLDYLRQTEQIKPEMEMAAEEYISMGWQRLLSFEVSGGGFSWFGDAPANKILTAYGLMEFNDMAKVYEIDERVIERTASWLTAQQNKDGSWSPDAQYLHAESWGKIQKSELMPTAYIVWALGEAGNRGTAVQKGLEYLKNNLKSANDPYILALVANAFVAVEPKGATTMEALKKLISKAKEEDDAMYWASDIPSITFSRGMGADIEATGLAAYALVRSGKYSDAVTKTLTYLIRSKDPSGLWYTTQGTVIALRSLVAALGGTTEEVDAQVVVKMNGKTIKELKIDTDNADLMHQIDLTGHLDKQNTVEVSVNGEGNFLYEITRAYYIPWKDLPRPDRPPFTIDVDYDRTELAINDVVEVDVSIKLNKAGTAQMVMVDLGIPPGFTVQTPTLDELVGKKIQKYTITPRQLIIYLDEVSSKKPVEFSYQIKAKYPIRAQVRSSRV
ncbi:MAG: hypothetical protein JSW02_03655, partial [candidate division WOR-3 bacterium]